MFDKIEVFIQVIESGSVENVRSRVRAIERKQANMIVVDLRPNYRAGYSRRHWTYFRSFRMNAKRRHNRRLTRSSLDSLAATLAALPSMSLAPLAPFRDFWGMTRGDCALRVAVLKLGGVRA